MSAIFTGDQSSLVYLGRRVSNTWFPRHVFSMTWQIKYVDIDVSAYHTAACVGPSDVEGFSGGNDYWTAAGGDGTGVDRRWHLGSDGSDQFASETPAEGVWHRQAFQRLMISPTSYELRYWYDLDDGQADVIVKTDSDVPVYTANARLSFGSVPYINNESIIGEMRCIKLWGYARPIDDLDVESLSGAMATRNGRVNLLGQWPLVNNGNDYSGREAHLTEFNINGGPSITFDNATDPGSAGIINPFNRSKFPKRKLRQILTARR